MRTEPAARLPWAGPCCFVYYRVPTARLAGALAAARAAQAMLRRELPGCHMGLMQRAADPTATDQTTLMEIYTLAPGEPVPDWGRVIEPAMAEALAAWQSGPRHLEAFVPCA